MSFNRADYRYVFEFALKSYAFARRSRKSPGRQAVINEALRVMKLCEEVIGQQSEHSLIDK